MMAVASELAMKPWKLAGSLGGGSYGCVNLYKNQITDEHIAVKILRNIEELTAEQKRNWKRECDLSMTLRHPNLVEGLPVPDQFATSAGTLPLLVMEYCSLGDLRKVLRRAENDNGLSEAEVRFVIHDISSAIEYLHKLQIVHRDIKPENVVLSQTQQRITYKLTDLGLAKDLSSGSICQSAVGTEYYMAPELFIGEKYTRRVDYWSLGIVIFECITGFGPFMDKAHPLFIQKELSAKQPDDIYGYFDANKKAVFSNKIPRPNQLCRTLQDDMEMWLRLMLDYEATSRGERRVTEGKSNVQKPGEQQKGGHVKESEEGKGQVEGYIGLGGEESYQKRPHCFELLDNILNRKDVHIFIVNNCELLSYPASLSTSVRELKSMLEMETSISLADQEILTDTGQVVSADNRASLYSSHSDGHGEQLLFLYDKTNSNFCHELRPLPPMLQNLPTNNSVVSPDVWKKICRHLVWYVARILDTARQLLGSKHAIYVNLKKQVYEFLKAKTLLSKKCTEFNSQRDLCYTALQIDVEEIEKLKMSDVQDSDSKSIFSSWQNSRELFRKFQEISDKLCLLNKEIQAKDNDIRNIELLRTSLGKEVPSFLENVQQKAKDILERHDSILHEPAGQSVLVQSISDCLNNCSSQWKTFSSAVFFHLRRIMHMRQVIKPLSDEVSLQLVCIDENFFKLREIQKQRQQDIWQIITHASTAVQQQRLLCQGPEHGAMSFGNALLPSPISAPDSLILIDEANINRKKLEDMIDSDRDCEGLTIKALDWNFLNPP